VGQLTPTCTTAPPPRRARARASPRTARISSTASIAICFARSRRSTTTSLLLYRRSRRRQQLRRRLQSRGEGFRRPTTDKQNDHKRVGIHAADEARLVFSANLTLFFWQVLWEFAPAPAGLGLTSKRVRLQARVGGETGAMHDGVTLLIYSSIWGGRREGKNMAYADAEELCFLFHFFLPLADVNPYLAAAASPGFVYAAPFVHLVPRRAHLPPRPRRPRRPAGPARLCPDARSRRPPGPPPTPPSFAWSRQKRNLPAGAGRRRRRRHSRNQITTRVS
jgi:hypothetical protein